MSDARAAVAGSTSLIATGKLVPGRLNTIILVNDKQLWFIGQVRIGAVS